MLSTFVDNILEGDKEKIETINRYIYSIYGLTEEQITYVRRMVNGKAD